MSGDATMSITASASSFPSAAVTRSGSGNAVIGLPPAMISTRRLPASISSAIATHGISPNTSGSSGRERGPGAYAPSSGAGAHGSRCSSGDIQPGVEVHAAAHVERAGHRQERPAQPLGDETVGGEEQARAGDDADAARGADRVEQRVELVRGHARTRGR